MDRELFDSLSPIEQFKFCTEVSDYLDRRFKVALKDWMHNGNFTCMTITISKNCEFYYGIEGEHREAKRGERKFAEAELIGRWKAAKNFIMRKQNYFRDDFSVVLKPLECSYDFDVRAGNDVYYVEAKDRNYASDSAVFKDGVMLEKLKVEEAWRDGTWDNLIYTSTFSDGKQYSWKLNELPRDTWVVRNMVCPDSTVNKKKDKVKSVYLLPLDYRCSGLDINVTY